LLEPSWPSRHWHCFYLLLAFALRNPRDGVSNLVACQEFSPDSTLYALLGR
jgi:hypothetical protein